MSELTVFNRTFVDTGGIRDLSYFLLSSLNNFAAEKHHMMHLNPIKVKKQ